MTNPNHRTKRAIRSASGFKPFAHLFCATLGLLLFYSLAQSATLTVQNKADSGAGSLRATLTAAASGDTITFAPALNGQMIVLTSGQLGISNSVNILGPGPDQLAISGNHSSRVFYLKSGITSVLAGVTITNGNAKLNTVSYGQGGGIFSHYAASITVSNCNIRGNSAEDQGGGIYMNGETLVTYTLQVLNSTISDNSASNGGGGIYNGFGVVTVQDSTISRNLAYDGSGIYSVGKDMAVRN